MKAVIQDIEQKVKTLEAEKKQASSNDDQHEWECIVEELEQYQKALELVKNNGVLHNVVRSCYWCDTQIKDHDELRMLPGGRGIAHESCAYEFYHSEMAND